ncbi:hypothetical protein Tco_0322827 [Tanacetum coccineum]
MHCVGKTVSDLHALLIDYEKGLKDKAPTPQVLAIQKGRVNKPKPQANKKGKSKGKADKNKQVVLNNTKTVFKSEVELQLGKKIKALRSDRGGEYLSQEFKEYLVMEGYTRYRNLMSVMPPGNVIKDDTKTQTKAAMEAVGLGNFVGRILGVKPSKRDYKTVFYNSCCHHIAKGFWKKKGARTIFYGDITLF